MVKILLVDDSETMRLQLKRDLVARSFIVAEASDGLDGLEKLKDTTISVVICDVNMPVMDGFTMCEKLLENGRSESLTIFMLTTEASSEMKERGKKLKVRVWITKPYDIEKLVAAIQKVTQTKVN